MALELMPDGKTFKKLNAIQEKAMSRYYRRLHDVPLTQSLALPIGLAVLGGIGALAYVFKDELQLYLKDKEEDVVEWIKGLPVAAGGGVADILIKAGDLIFPQNPLNPEYIQLDPILNPDGTTTPRPPTGPFSRCQRWGLDADDVVALINEKGPSTVYALALKRIITNMKKEGCTKPQVITQAQWED